MGIRRLGSGCLRGGGLASADCSSHLHIIKIHSCLHPYMHTTYMYAYTNIHVFTQYKVSLHIRHDFHGHHFWQGRSSESVGGGVQLGRRATRSKATEVLEKLGPDSQRDGQTYRQHGTIHHQTMPHVGRGLRVSHVTQTQNSRQPTPTALNSSDCTYRP